MEWLNYHHLLYFWNVVRDGGIVRASARLRLRPSTLSAQIRQLEETLGEPLFSREGRRLQLTEAGRLAFGYAEEIFALGREMLEGLRGRQAGPRLKATIGISDALPKMIAGEFLEFALALPEPVRLVCREDHPERLMAALAIHELDLVLTDAPLPAGSGVRAFSHPLGESGITFFAPRSFKVAKGQRFPEFLDDAPLLLPTENSALRRQLDGWFKDHGLTPRIVAEFDDSALLKAFGQKGHGLFAAPAVLEAAVVRQYGVRAVGRTDEVKERYFAISPERRISHPAVAALVERAKDHLIGLKGGVGGA